MAVVRVRQHVNPLSDKYQQSIEPPDWAAVYADLSLPLHLDIGCGRGHFLLKMAQQQPEWNYLGLEIREPLVIQANEWRQDINLTNLHYIFCNANNSLRSLFASFPTGTLQRVSIQFPDPWFKKRHQKRRVVQPELVEELALHLAAEGTVFLQSDVEAVEVEMCDRFHEHPAFTRLNDKLNESLNSKLNENQWLESNPLPVSTEREQSTLLRGEPVYRALFIRRESV